MSKSNLKLEETVEGIIHGGTFAGELAGATAGAIYGPSLLGSSLVSTAGTTLGMSNAALASSLLGTIPGGILGYAALNTVYKLTRDTLKTTYNALAHPVESVKKLGSTIKSFVTRPYRIITKPLGYVLKPAFARSQYGGKNAITL